MWYLVRDTEWNSVGFFLECSYISGMNYWYVQLIQKSDLYAVRCTVCYLVHLYQTPVSTVGSQN